jgi:hypothetical protein
VVGLLLVLGMAHGSDEPIKPGRGGQDVVVQAYPPYQSYATGRLTWVGGNNYGKYSGPPEFGVATTGTNRGWVKFDLSGIPDGVQVNEVVLAYHCYYRYSSRPSTAVRCLTLDPIATSAPTLWTDFSNGLVAADSVNHDTGWVYRNLNANGIAAVQAGLAGDWAAFGLEEAHNLLNYGGRADAYYSSSFRPVLMIGFTADVDMAIAGCGSLTYPLVEGLPESLYVDVANVGANTVSGAKVYLVDDSVRIDSTVMPAMAPGTQLRRIFTLTPARSGGERHSFTFQVIRDGDGNPLNDAGEYDDWVFPRGTWWAEGFDNNTSFPPPGWSIVNADGGLYSWGGGTPTTAHAGENHGRCPNESSLRNDDWLIAPPQFITAGYQDTLGLFVRTTSSINPDTLQVWAMDGPTPADTVAFIAMLVPASTEYTERRLSLRSFAGQTIRIGLRKLSRSPNSTLVDDLSLMRRPQIDMAAEAITAPAAELRLPVVEHPAVRVRNLGIADANFSIRVLVRYGYDVVYDTIEAGIVLAPGEATTRTFTKPWQTGDTGSFRLTAFVGLSGDGCRWNDTVYAATHVAPVAVGSWAELGNLPLTPSGKQVKDGGWLAWLAGQGRMYAAKGNKVGDFYVYEPSSGTWQERTSWPMGLEAKGPGKGANATGDGNNRIYATKGNNTLGFWAFDAGANCWTQLPDVPLGPSNKKVKGGTDLAYAESDGHGYVYLLKGMGSELYRYDIASDTWVQLQDAPAGTYPKWDKGSWLVVDGEGGLWAHKAKVSELWRFDVATGTWSASSAAGIPLSSPVTGKRKKSKDGSAAAVQGGILYAVKGGNTQEFWRLELERNLWSELDTIPAVGSSGRKKRIKGGGDLETDGTRLFVMKGNKTLETWSWGPLGLAQGAVPGRRDGLQDERRPAVGRAGLQAALNPAPVGQAGLSYFLPATGVAGLEVVDASGRIVFQRAVTGSAGSVALPGLGRGVYVARLAGAAWSRSLKLTVY